MTEHEYAGTHLGDFKPPWESVRFRRKDGFMVKLSNTVAIFATPPADAVRSGWECWECQLLLGISRRVAERFHVDVNRNRNAAYEVLSRASQSLDHDETYLDQAAEAAWRMILDSQDEPDLPVPAEPRPGRWYDPRKRIPARPFPVAVAWTGPDGSKHGDDRTAFHKDGRWYWAFGAQDEIPSGTSVDAWTVCPGRPPEWKR